ncbi:MAG: hypothetical protein GF334_08235 [Candidatus Altiarchaeales archaeon]|nr:hypothetical protein [Candidatus Altiarchaeales archaeon]
MNSRRSGLRCQRRRNNTSNLSPEAGVRGGSAPMFSTTDPATCCDPEPADTDNSLKQKLLSRIYSHAQQVQQPAKDLFVEVDGILAGKLMRGREFILPEDARSITLVDENQTARVHILTVSTLACERHNSYTLKNALFDQDRLSINLKGKSLLVEDV